MLTGSLFDATAKAPPDCKKVVGSVLKWPENSCTEENVHVHRFNKYVSFLCEAFSMDLYSCCCGAVVVFYHRHIYARSLVQV